MLKHLLRKEFLQMRRNAFLPRLIVAFPILMMCVMPWVMNQEVKDLRVSVVDHDRSVASRRLIHSIAHNSHLVLSGQQPSYAAALKEIEKSRTDLVLVIPPDYGRTMASAAAGHPLAANRGGGQLLIAANAVNGTKGAIGSGYLAQLCATAHKSVECRVHSVEFASAVPSGEGMAVANSKLNTLNSNLSPLPLYNKHQDYKVFMIPALLAIVMMLMCGFLPALNIVGEKETGTIEQINVTPVSKWSFILAKLIPYWLVGLFVVTVCLLLAWLVYGVTCQGPLWLVYALAMLLALFFSSFGLLVSNHSDTLQQAVFVMWFFVVSLLLLSGLFTPTRSMPGWAYATTYVNPMHHFIDAIRTVFVRGGTLHDVAPQVLALLAIGLAMAVWAVASYRKNSA